MQNAIISTKRQTKSFVHFYVFFFQKQVPKYGEIWGYGVQKFTSPQTMIKCKMNYCYLWSEMELFGIKEVLLIATM